MRVVRVGVFVVGLAVLVGLGGGCKSGGGDGSDKQPADRVLGAWQVDAEATLALKLAADPKMAAELAAAPQKKAEYLAKTQRLGLNFGKETYTLQYGPDVARKFAYEVKDEKDTSMVIETKHLKKDGSDGAVRTITCEFKGKQLHLYSADGERNELVFKRKEKK